MNSSSVNESLGGESTGEISVDLFPVFNNFLLPFKSKQNRLFVHANKSTPVINLVWAAFHNNIPYIPADVANPVERVKSIFNQINPSLIFIEKDTPFYIDNVSKLKSVELWSDQNLLLLSLKNEKEIFHHPNLASVLFTSGSTGIPKGVMIPKINTTSFVNWTCTQFNINQSSRVLSVSPLHFDLSVFDIFSAYFHKAKLFLPEKGFVMNPLYLAEFIFKNKIDTIYATPTWYTLLLSFGKMKRYDFSFVKTILVAGEAFKTILAEQLHATFVNASISNLYGPTETNVCTYHSINFEKPAQRNSVIAIGKACPYNEVNINADHILTVSGNTVMLGYWPLLIENESYSTGDLVETDKEETIYFVGRADGMIKRNGYRIEPGEIESCLLFIKNINNVAVTSTNKADKVVITAHIQSVDMTLLNIFDLKAHCLVNLPSYMVPDEFILHEHLPQTASGKIDYKKLSEHGK